MNHEQVKRARQALGLSVAGMAAMLDTDPQSVRRWEMPPDRSTSRDLPPRAARLIRAYLNGFRPIDWPG